MKILFHILIVILVANPSIYAQKRKKKNVKEKQVLQYQHDYWRNIGPFRGGRSVTSEGVLKSPSTFYMGTTGGGIWKTTDNGINWKNISDGQLATGTVGALAVSESDPNIIIAGMGEHAARGVMTSMGDGVYKSEDAGKTWKHIGLENSRHIANIEIHPTNPEVFYVAVQGAQYGPSSSRGIYRTTDGGKNWKKVLYVDKTVGAASLSMDKNNPRILYAAMWDHLRTPWQMRSGGPGSGIYKSTDGGDKWTRLENGLPKEFGKAGVSVSRANSELLYLNLEGEIDASGVYRSEDAGNTWQLVNKDRVTVARSWYYMEVFADPQDENVVYVLNAPVLKSIDKGKTFKPLPTPHGDNHHLWIHPYDNTIMINSNDGGANVSTNGGVSWSSQQNQPTAQFYRVIADQQVPYHVYGGQQDNSAIGIKSRTQKRGIDWKDWYSVAGCESAFLAFDPENPQAVYGGCYQGIIEVWQRKTQSSKAIKEYPELALGNTPKDFKYRFNWNAPIISAPSDSRVIYHAGNVVFKTTNGGIDWDVISPDLTRNNKAQQGPGGLPYTNEAAGGENYNTLMSLSASVFDANELWAGSDDGLVHLTRDGGATWKNITPKGLQEGIINSIELSSHRPGTAYMVVMRYKFMDLKPYIYKTSDYGESWKLITNGISGKHNFVRVVREDKKVPGLLYAGTETGFFISNNDGKQWKHFQTNLPVVPINDLYIQDNDLIAATAGRSFWVWDDLSPLQEESKISEFHLVTPKPAYRLFSRKTPQGSSLGTNPLSGVILDYYLPQTNDSLTLSLEILEANQVIRRYSSKAAEKAKTWTGGPQPKQLLEVKKGFNRTHWDLRRTSVLGIDDVFVYGNYAGSRVAPGKFTARLTYGDQTREVPLLVLANPNIASTAEQFAEQQKLLIAIDTTLGDIHQEVNSMRNVKTQLKHYQNMFKGHDEFKLLNDKAVALEKALYDWEINLIQPKQKTFQDVINFNNKLNAEWMNLKAYVDAEDPQVTQGAKQRFNDLSDQWKAHKKKLRHLIDDDFSTFINAFKAAEVPVLFLNQ
ncbi:MAG: VPS10 domain-containing protein [Flavobacteriaceae bacterium]